MDQCHPLQPEPQSQPDQLSSIDSIFQPIFDGCSEADYASATSLIALADGGVVADFSDSNSEDISLGSSVNSLGRKSWDSEYDTFASEDEEEGGNGIKHNNEDNDIMRANLSKTLDDKSALGSDRSDVEYVSCSSSIIDLDEQVIDSPSRDLGPKCSNNAEIESLGSSTGSLGLSTVKQEANWDSEYDTFASDNDEDDNDFMNPEPPRPADEPFLKSPDSVDYVSASSMHGLDERIKDPPLKFDTSLSSSEHLLLGSSKDARGQVVFRDESDSEYDTFESEDDDDNNNNNNNSNNNYDIMEPEFPRTKEDLFIQSIFENFVRFGTLPRVKRKTRDVKTSETIFNAQGIAYPTFPRKWTYGTLPRPRPKARSTMQPSTFSTFGTYSRSHPLMLNIEPVLNRNLDSIPEEIGSPVYGLALTSDAMAKHGIKELFERSHSTIPRSFQGSVKRARDVNDWNKFG